MATTAFSLAILYLLLGFNPCASFPLSMGSRSTYRTALSATSSSEDQEHYESSTRRSFIEAFGGGVSALLLTTDGAFAKVSSQELEDKAKLLKGYQRLSYLLDNWEAETTICGQTDNPYTGTKGCDRTPIKVMEYMGYKSMDDPLFKADKTMRRLEPLVPPERETEYFDAVEKWGIIADEASGMAYVSSWGEANPGGGKDRVEYFIERAKKNVEDARSVLATAIDILNIKA